MLPLLAALLALQAASAQPAAAAPVPAAPVPAPVRTIAIDQRLAEDYGLRVGDRVVLATTPGGAGDTVRVGAVLRRQADPSEVAHTDYRVQLHLDQLQSLVGYGDRVDRFAVATRGGRAGDSVLRTINDAAFGFRGYRSREIAVETSRTFLVVSRFHRAIGVITIVASAIFLLCILLLKVDERRRDVAALRLMGISRRSVIRSVVIEASLVALLGSVMGVGIGAVVSRIINWHYQGVYRTPLVFSLVTPDIALFAAGLSLVLGVAVGFLAAWRLVSAAPLSLFGR